MAAITELYMVLVPYKKKYDVDWIQQITDIQQMKDLNRFGQFLFFFPIQSVLHKMEIQEDQNYF